MILAQDTEQPVANQEPLNEQEETLDSVNQIAIAQPEADIEFTEDIVKTASLSPTFEAYLTNYVKNAGWENKDGELTAKIVNGKEMSYVNFLRGEVKRVAEGTPVDQTPLLMFCNTPKLQAPGEPSYFPRELYPEDNIFIGVGNREKRYLAQLERILNNERLAGLLAYVAMRKFYYTGGSMNIGMLKNRHANKSLNFVPILDKFINDNMIVLLHVADQIFGAEMAAIKLQQKDLADAQLAYQKKVAEQLQNKAAENLTVSELPVTESVIETQS